MQSAASGDSDLMEYNTALFLFLDGGSGASDFILTPSLSTPPSVTPSLTPSSSVTPSLFPSLSPSLFPSLPPTLSPSPPPPSAMAVAPILYLIAVPVVLGALLTVIILLSCCILITYHIRRKKQRNKQGKHGSNAGRMDQSKSLESYGGNGRNSNSVAKSEEPTNRYELHTMDSRVSLGSPTTQYPSNTLPATTTTRQGSSGSNTYIGPPHSQSMEALQSHPSPYHHPPPPHITPSPLHTHMSPLLSQGSSSHLQGIPEQRQLLPDGSGSGNGLPHTSDGFDPASLYDVPASALLAGSSPVQPSALSQSPQGLYDVPKNALIATGHYKVPPLYPSVYLSHEEGLYDVPPPASGIYDVPPNVYYMQDGVEDLVYDVPPGSVGFRPRLNSQPTSQKDLHEVRRSITGRPDNVFASAGLTGGTVPNYSHYDVPRYLLARQAGSLPQQGDVTQPGKRLSRRNSNPITTRNHDDMLYDVPHSGIHKATSPPRPPTAPKPSRKQRVPPARSYSISSTQDIHSPDRKPQHPDAIFYDIAPLNAEFLAQHKKQNTSSEPGISQHVPRTAPHQQQTPTRHGVLPARSGSLKKPKVPPPTKLKPGRRGESVRN